MTDKLTRLAELLGKATITPWTCELNGGMWVVDTPLGTIAETGFEDSFADAQLICDLRNYAPAMLKALKAADAWLEADTDAHRDSLTDVYRIIEPTSVRVRREAYRAARAELENA